MLYFVYPKKFGLYLVCFEDNFGGVVDLKMFCLSSRVLVTLDFEKENEERPTETKTKVERGGVCAREKTV